MSKQAKRKITVNISPKIKTLPKTRPSVFERLGTKASSTHKEVCHHWAQHGTCPYGKGCKYSSTHTLISPSKQRLAKKENESKKRHSKEGVHKRQHSSSAKSTQSPEQVWNQWDPTELEDVDAADLEKRREELQRELDLQMKMESKARKKEKKSKLESSPSTDSSSSSTDSSSSSEESSSSSSSSVETTRRKRKKTKGKQRDSSSSSEREQVRKRKSKIKQHSFKISRSDKSKKASAKATVKIVAKSPSPVRSVKKSQTPPPKIKTFVPLVNELSKSKSPRPSSRSSDRKEKHRTPSPKLIKEKEKEKEKQVKDREREKEKDREKEKEKEREREKEKEREREKEREKEKEREREKLKERERERERSKEVRKREVKSPKRDSKGSKDTKRRESPDSTHSRDRKLSPSRSRGSGSAGSRRDNSRKNSPAVTKDDRRSDKREDRDRSKDRGDRASDKNRKDTRDSRDCTERDRDRERRITREEREAAREKDREEALARCQERQRERERLKELAKKEEERRSRAHREDRGLDKPTGDRVERLLPLPADRVPPNRRGRSPNNKRINNRDKSRDIRRDRTPDRSRSDVRKSVDRHEHLERDGGRIDHIDRERMDRSYDHGYDRPDRNFDRDRNDDRDRKRDYGTMPPRLREPDRRHEEKNYESPYDRRLEDRRYLEMEDRFNENSRDDRIPLDTRDYPDDRRVHRDMWEVRDEREIERDRELDQRRYGREDSRPRSLKGREWDGMDYPDHEWDHGRRPVDWDGRGGWDNREHDPAQLEEEWRHYNRSMDSWTADDRRRWAEWRDRSRPQSTTSHQEAEEVNDPHKRELPKSESVEFPQQQQEVEIKSDTVLGKRPAEENVESLIEPKKVCISETPLEDNLSEISDDADEILNREEDLPEPQIEETLSADSAPKPAEKEVQEVAEPSIASVPQNQKSPSPSRSPARLPKEESIDDENMDLDFEEISEDELEEENRVKGLGDALGVDWASLVAESRPRHKPISSAKRRWESHNILVNIGISVEMAGEALVKEIFKKHEEEKLKEELEEKGVKNEEVEQETSHSVQNEGKSLETPETSDTIIPHPVAAIQVAIREKEAMRKSLFASAGPFRRALSARRDLAIRRHLCDLPINDAFVETPRRHDPELYKQALELFERNL